MALSARANQLVELGDRFTDLRAKVLLAPLRPVVARGERPFDASQSALGALQGSEKGRVVHRRSRYARCTARASIDAQRLTAQRARIGPPEPVRG